MNNLKVTRNKILFLFLGIVLLTSFVSAFSMTDPFGDYDSDGVLNIHDNCYYVYNPFQVDSDGDNWGNCCDADYVGLFGWCDYAGGYCGDGICSGGEDYLTCPEDCSAPSFCGDGILDVGESCDDGPLNGVECNNSTSSCEYCSSTCELITLPYSEDEEDDDDDCCKNNNELNFYCEPNWDCGGWSSCSNHVKIRTCKDTNYCSFAYNKPVEKIGCEESVFESSVFSENEINYLFLLFSLLSILLLIIILVLALKERK